MEGQKGIKHLENLRGTLKDRDIAIATSYNVHDKNFDERLNTSNSLCLGTQF